MIGAIEINRKITRVEAGLLPGLDPAIDRVGDHHHGDWRFHAHDGFHLADGKAEAAIAHYGHYLGRWFSEPRAERGRHAVAQRAVCAIGKKAPPGFTNLVVRREVRTRRAGVSDDDGVVRQHGLQIMHHALGQDRRGIAVRQREKRRALVCLGLGDNGSVEPRRHLEHGLPVQAVDELAQHDAAIADQPQISRVVGADHRGVDVDMQHLGCARCRKAPPLGRDTASAATDEHHQIGHLDHCAGPRRAAVAADHAHIQRVRLGHAALPANRRRDTGIEQLGQLRQLALGP